MQDEIRFRPDPSLEEIIRRGRVPTIPPGSHQDAAPANRQRLPLVLLVSVVAGLLILVLGHSLTTFIADDPSGQHLPQRQASASMPAATPAPMPRAQQPKAGLAADNAAAWTWCAAAGCSAAQFGPLVEASGSVNPEGVHFDGGGGCFAFALPAGVEADYWDGLSAHMGVVGPVRLEHVCEASFRIQ